MHTRTRTETRTPDRPSPATPGEAVTEPLLRDAPPPPGWVDPLAGSDLLEDLDAPDRRRDDTRERMATSA
jgi:hypothetical protein